MSPVDCGTAQPVSRDPVEALAEEFLSRLRQGEMPALSEFIELAPEHAEEIRELFPALVLMEQADPVASVQDPRASLNVERLGDYRIIREVGRGGMGVVYEAVQESLGRRVALKVLPPAVSKDPRSLLRFHREARTAARLHHTNIVPVFDVGEREGVHYFAMQFIKGQPLHEVIKELSLLRRDQVLTPGRNLTVTSADGHVPHQASDSGIPAAEQETLEHGNSSVLTDRSEFSIKSNLEFYRSVAHLGEQVADALAYAHGERMLHRDIKPANLILDLRGSVWVTDFGLAKEEGDDLTHTGDVVGTLRYLAPERLNGVSDSRSDIYSLGLTLYELVTQQPAFAENDRVSLVRAITHKEPIAPRRLEPQVPRDLETIILKAIAKEPSARYDSAGELREDLQRFLADRPIRARRVTNWEQGRRWCRRNPGWAATLATVIGLLVLMATGGAILNWRLQRAMTDEHDALLNVQKAQFETYAALEREKSARKRVWTTLSRISDRVVEETLARKSHLTPQDKSFLREILGDYEAFANETGDSAESRALRAEGLFRVGLLRYGLGEWRDAENAYRSSILLREQLLAAFPDTVEFRLDLAKTHNNLGVLLNETGRSKQAKIAYSAAQEIQRKLVAEYANVPEYRADLARSCTNVGIILTEMSKYTQAESLLEEGLRLRNQLVAELPKEPEHLQDLGCSFSHLAVLMQSALRLKESEAAYRASIDLRTRLVSDYPTIAKYRLEQARSEHGLGILLWEAGRVNEAESLYRRALGTQLKLVAEFPAVPQYRRELATSHCNLAVLLSGTPRHDDAQTSFETALDLQGKLVADAPEVTDYQYELAVTHSALGNHLSKQGKVKAALTALRAALELQSRLVEEIRSRPRFRHDLAIIHNDLGLVYIQGKDYEAAENAFQSAVEIQTKLLIDLPSLAGLKTSLGGSLVNQAIIRNSQNRFDLALQKLVLARAQLDSELQLRPDAPKTRRYWRNCCWTQCGSNLGLKDHCALALCARELAAFNFEPDDGLRAAAFLSQCALLASKDSTITGKQRDDLAEKYGKQAVELLRKVDHSVLKGRHQIESDKSFAPLYSRADCREFLAELDSRKFDPR